MANTIICEEKRKRAVYERLFTDLREGSGFFRSIKALVKTCQSVPRVRRHCARGRKDPRGPTSPYFWRVFSHWRTQKLVGPLGRLMRSFLSLSLLSFPSLLATSFSLRLSFLFAFAIRYCDKVNADFFFFFLRAHRACDGRLLATSARAFVNVSLRVSSREILRRNNIHRKKNGV